MKRVDEAKHQQQQEAADHESETVHRAAPCHRLSRSRPRWFSRERTSTVPLAGAASGAAAGAGADPGGGRRRPRGGLLQKPVERQLQQAGVVACVDHDLGDVRIDLAHGVDVEPLARHLRRLLVLDQLTREAIGVALGLRDHSRLVAFGFLAQARRGSLRLRNLRAGVGLPFLLQAVAVLAGLERVLERRLHLLGRLHALDVDVDDQDAGLEAIELGLDRLHEIVGDRVALLVQHRVDLALADDLAHRRLGGEQSPPSRDRGSRTGTRARP